MVGDKTVTTNDNDNPMCGFGERKEGRRRPVTGNRRTVAETACVRVRAGAVLYTVADITDKEV